MTDAEMTPGEIQRWLERIDKSIEALTTEVRDRHHTLSGEVRAVIGPISTLAVRMDAADMRLDGLDDKVDAVRTQAATIAGGISVFAVLASLIPWPWRHS